MLHKQTLSFQMLYAAYILDCSRLILPNTFFSNFLIKLNIVLCTTSCSRSRSMTNEGQNGFKPSIKRGLVWYMDGSKTSKNQQGATLCSKCGAAKCLSKGLQKRSEMVEVHETLWCHPTVLHSILQ